MMPMRPSGGLLATVGESPLFNMGMGLLAGAGPNNPNQWAGGIQQGLLNIRAGNDERQRRQFLEMRQQQQQQEAYQRHIQAAQEAAQREYQQRYLQTLPEEQRTTAQAMGVGEYAQMQAKEQFSPAAQPRTIKGADGRNYWLDGPNAGQPVLPDVQAPRYAAPQPIDPNNPNSGYVQFDPITGKAHSVGGGGTSVSTTVKMPGQDDYLKERGKGMAGSLTTMEQGVPAAMSLAKAAHGIKAMTDAGAHSGPMAPGIIGAQTFLGSLGVNVDQEKLTNSETVRALTKQAVLDAMSSMGGARGFSKEETAILEQAYPQITQSPEARKAIADILQRKSVEHLKRYQAMRGRELERYGDESMLGDRTLYDEASQMLQLFENDAPPMAGARRAPDGNWYIQKDGETYRVD